jgi:hypothetical protein
VQRPRLLDERLLDGRYDFGRDRVIAGGTPLRLRAQLGAVRGAHPQRADTRTALVRQLRQLWQSHVDFLMAQIGALGSNLPNIFLRVPIFGAYSMAGHAYWLLVGLCYGIETAHPSERVMLPGKSLPTTSTGRGGGVPAPSETRAPKAD